MTSGSRRALEVDREGLVRPLAFWMIANQPVGVVPLAGSGRLVSRLVPLTMPLPRPPPTPIEAPPTTATSPLLQAAELAASLSVGTVSSLCAP